MPHLPLAIAFLACCALCGCGEAASASSMPQSLVSTSFPDSGIYAITTFVSTEHGRLSASKNQASAGLTITISVEAEPGYSLRNISSEEVTLATVSEGKTYTFVMPPCAVNVVASFAIMDSSVSGT